MKRIHFPLRNIVLNIFTDTVQLEIIPDDMFPVIALPDSKNVCVVSKPFGAPLLKPLTTDPIDFGIMCWYLLYRRAFCKGSRSLNPYVSGGNNPMNMIGHHHEFI